MSEKEDTPNIVSSAYRSMCQPWAKMDSVLGGTRSMREAGKAYLPQHEGEDEDTYNERLNAAVLLNRTKETLESFVGRPFSKPIDIDQAAESIKPLFADIDRQGNDLHKFCRSWFRGGLAKGLSHILVDFPVARDTEAEEGRTRTLADDLQEGLRPYWVMVEPENLLFARSEFRGGKEIIVHARIREVVTEPDGMFGEKEITQIKVWEPGVVQTWRLVKTKGQKEEWRMVDEAPMALDFVPLVTFYSERTDFMQSELPLENLADINVSHWQSGSDQRAVLTVARFPILAVSGASEVNQVKIGPKQFLKTDDVKGKYYYVEHEGKAIAAGMEDLKALEEQMAEFGAEFLKRTPGNVTATAKALDSAESISKLQNYVLLFNDAANLALEYTKAWFNVGSEKVKDAGVITIHREFGPPEGDTAALDALKAARGLRDISRETYLNELKRRDVLVESFDVDEDKALLEKETMDLPGAPAEEDIDPQQEPEPEPKQEPTEEES